MKFFLIVILSCLVARVIAFRQRFGQSVVSSTKLNYSVKVINKKRGTETVIDTDGSIPILEAGEEQGVTDIPYSCRAGSCSACIGKMISGSVDQSMQIFLSDEKMDAGYILTCVATAEEDCEIMVGEDVEASFYDEVREEGDTFQ